MTLNDGGSENQIKPPTESFKSDDKSKVYDENGDTVAKDWTCDVTELAAVFRRFTNGSRYQPTADRTAHFTVSADDN